MLHKAMKISGVKFGLPCIFMAMLIASLAGCGGGGGGFGDYDVPTATLTVPLAGQTSNVLMDAATLQGWFDQGLVNNEANFEKVVILDVTSAANYGAGHIPGAQLWNAGEQLQTRIEGPAPSVNMVLDGASMDAMIRKHGIHKNTTIVFTTSAGGSNTDPSRAYFLFRYWGFPKERLKVLNGYNGGWTAAGKALVTAVPVVTATDCSVRDDGAFNPGERVSLSELIVALESGVGVPVDFRGDKSAPGSTPGVFAPAGDFVVFEGLLRNGKPFPFGNFTNADGTFKDAQVIKNDLAAAGIDNSQLLYSVCRTGIIASTGYFVLDGLLGWEVMLYDGSWSQWGQLSSNAAMGGQLPAGSLWATDNTQLMDIINYNQPAGFVIEVLAVDNDALALYPNPALPAANRIENEDAQYMVSGGGGSGGGAPAPGYGN